MKLTFKNTIQSYLLVIFFGMLAGSLCAVLDLYPNDSIWTFSSFSGSLGFWALSGMLILMQSENWKLSAINTFLYFAFMNTAFFFVHLLLPFQFPRVSTFSEACLQSLAWTIPSLGCGLCAILTCQAKKDNWLGIFTLSLPCGLMLYEFICTLFSVFIYHRYLFQSIVNLCGIILLFCLYKGKKNPLFLCLTIAGGAAALLLLHCLLYQNILYY